MVAINTALLKAKHIGVRQLKAHLSAKLRGRNPLVVTEHGEPTKVIISYKDMLEIIDILDELQDRQVLEVVREARKAVKNGAKGIPVSSLFQKIRA